MRDDRVEFGDVGQLLDFARCELAIIDPDAGLDQLTLDAPLAALDLESLTLVSLLTALEDRCAVRVPRELLTDVRTVRELLEAVLDQALAR